MSTASEGPLAQQITLFRFNCHMFRTLTRTLDENQLEFRPNDRANSLRWILGHLVVTLDSALRSLGAPGQVDPSWRAAFDRGTTDNPSMLRPTKAELLGALDTLIPAIETAAGRATSDILTQPHTLAFLAQTPIRTRGDLLSHALVTHMSFHLGQLSAYRRQLGFEPLF